SWAELAEAVARLANRRRLRRPHDRERGSSWPVASDRCPAVYVVSGNFSAVVVCDFEYEAAPGELPDALCMVAHVLDENLQHVRTIHLWRGEFGSAPPFDVGSDTLFVAYSAWAEMTCFKVLGWPFPVHIFDQHTAYLAASNVLLPHNPDGLRKKPRKRLP